MAIFLLDTSVIIDALNEKKKRSAFLFDIVERGHLAVRSTWPRYTPA
jgi:hypothetical protein